MRKCVSSAGLVLLLPAVVAAQAPSDAVPVLSPSGQSVLLLPDRSSLLPKVAGELQSASQTHRWSAVQKGALIGAGAGVGVGIAVGLALCDGAHCYTSGYVKDAAVFGAIGAGIGALIGSAVEHSHSGANSFPTIGRKVAISPMISQDSRGGLVRVRF
jgi:hypothetical protein